MPEPGDTLLADERILPVQYASLFHKRARTWAEMLALAVLEQAVSDLLHYRQARNHPERRLHREALKWICSNDRSHIFSFVNICEVLGFCPAVLRAALVRARRQDSSSLPTAA